LSDFGYLTLGLVAGLAAIERKGFLQAMLSRPIVLGPVTGWALGDAAGGLLLGPPLELLWLGAVNLGAAVPVHEALGTTAIVGAAVMAAHRLGGPVTPEIAALAALIAMPAAYLGRLGERRAERWNEGIAARAEAELSSHHPRAAAASNLCGLAVSFAIGAVVAPLVAAVAAFAIPALLHSSPGLSGPLHVGFLALAAAASAAAVKALRARAAPLAFFGAAAGTVAVGVVALLAGRVL
jgi:mannose/fructose/N-acetylgalactosamine-specific phosphotransferase system component IIC